jgi:Poly(R)-hydroxyalkanoic acid synthase subunit (PHA_synth_III_E)
MAEQQQSKAPPDPVAAFRELVTQWEKGINEFANKAMNSDEFARAMNKATTTSTTMQQQLGELIGRYLMTLNLPTRSEMTSISERLQTIETSLHRISSQLDKLTGSGDKGSSAGPPRTKRPPSAASGGAS